MNLLNIMMKQILSFVLALFLAVPVLFADPVEVEIQLIEIGGFGLIGGDDPWGNPDDYPTTPPRPTDFHATITGNALTVTVDNTNSTNLIVRNASGNVVVNSQFVSLTSEFLSTSGNYSLEIHNGGLTLVGQFVVQ